MQRSSIIVGILTVLLVGCSSAPTKGAATIEEAFSNKYDVPVEDVTIKIRIEMDEYIAGEVRLGDEPGGGGVFFAVQQDGRWIIAADGNGIPDCSELDQYGIPVEMMEVCLTEDGDLKER